jgi:hypothetical protein
MAAATSARLPPPLDLEKASFKFPPDGSESLNTVLCQEIIRYNRYVTPEVPPSFHLPGLLRATLMRCCT